MVFPYRNPLTTCKYLMFCDPPAYRQVEERKLFVISWLSTREVTSGFEAHLYRLSGESLTQYPHHFFS